VAGYSGSSAEKYLQTISERYKCDSVLIKSANALDESTKLEAIFYKTDSNPETSWIYLDRHGKILFADLFDKLYGMNRYDRSHLVVRVPFETDEHGSVYLQVKLQQNGKLLKLLFDTGADGMALRESLADSLGIRTTRHQNTSVVGGNRQIAISENNVIYLDTFAISNQNIALFKQIRGDADGIIGNNITKLFITKVDYDRQEFSLYNFGDYQNKPGGVYFPLQYSGGIFTIPATLELVKGRSYPGNFVFDLGASYSLICFRPFVVNNRLLVDGFKPMFSSSTTSLGMTTPTFCGTASSLSIAGNRPIQDILVTLMSGNGAAESWKPGVDGSIGTRILSRYNFTINVQRKEIYCIPNKSYRYPPDFTLGNYVMGFDIDGRLRIQSQVSLTEGESILPGTIIKTINGIEAKDMANDRKKLTQLLSIPPGKQLRIETQ
jgi:hypothetical protein